DVQQLFFRPRPAEALYDLETDPHEVHNLAGDPAYENVLGRMRAVLQVNTKSSLDLSFFPEPYFLEHGSDNPVAFGLSRVDRIEGLIVVAEPSLWSFEQAREKIAAARAAEDPWERYWGCIVCSCFDKQAAEFVVTAR